MWDRILQHLVKVTRTKAGRNAGRNATYAIIDSQSVDITYKNEQVDFDGVAEGISQCHDDTMGNILAACSASR